MDTGWQFFPRRNMSVTALEERTSSGTGETEKAVIRKRGKAETERRDIYLRAVRFLIRLKRRGRP